MAITIYDIAREAKVGIGTVSRVLNNSPKVTTETRERVNIVAKRLNYQPHAFAQALARKRSNTLSAIIPFFTNYFFIEVLQGVQETLVPLGYDLIIHGVTNKGQMEEYLSKNVKKGRIDGTLLFSMELSDSLAQEFLERKIPLVLVDTYHPLFDSIRVDNVEGAKIATEYLINLGYKNIGMITANVRSVPAKERLMSFRSTLTANDMSLKEEYICSSTQEKNDGFNREAGYESMNQMIARNSELPDAIFVSSDIQAIGVIAALQEHGLNVPGDVGIISFDDVEFAKHFNLTTMRQPMHKMGELAVRKLLERIENNDLPVTLEQFIPTLIIRKSCELLTKK